MPRVDWLMVHIVHAVISGSNRRVTRTCPCHSCPSFNLGHLSYFVTYTAFPSSRPLYFRILISTLICARFSDLHITLININMQSKNLAWPAPWLPQMTVHSGARIGLVSAQ